jgi:hypothetical protein
VEVGLDVPAGSIVEWAIEEKDVWRLLGRCY